jgi:hypothetical protein
MFFTCRFAINYLKWLVVTVIIWYWIGKEPDFFKDIRRKARWLTYSAVSFATLFDAERVVPQLAAMLNECFDLRVLR